MSLETSRRLWATRRLSRDACGLRREERPLSQAEFRLLREEFRLLQEEFLLLRAKVRSRPLPHRQRFNELLLALRR